MYTLGLLFAFISMFLFGIGDSLFALPARKYKARIILFFQYFFMVILSFLFFWKFFFKIKLSLNLFFPILAGIFEILGILFLIKSLKKEKIGLSIAIASSYPLITFLYDFFILKESLNLIQIISILLIVFGIFLVSLKKTEKIKFNKNLNFAFISLFFWGLLTIMQKYSTFYYLPEEMTLIMIISSFLLILIFSLFFIKFKDLVTTDKKSIGIIFLIGFFLLTAIFFVNSSFKLIEASVTSAISGSSALITALIGILFFKERHFKFQYFGIALIVLSLFCLSYFG